MGLEAARETARRLRREAGDAIAPLGARGALLDHLATLIVERHA
jgi:hypothetical protein